MHGAEPGTGEQIAIFASPHDVDDGHPCVFHINGKKWKVGHEYIDTELADVCELVEVFAKSSWCDTREPEDCPVKLRFQYERYGEFNNGEMIIDPHSMEFDPDRFIERHERPLPRSAEYPW